MHDLLLRTYPQSPRNQNRNYDILAAVFTDVLQFMHDDFDLI
jgi:hypothetical protein